jgi:hypothetical protein
MFGYAPRTRERFSRKWQRTSSVARIMKSALARHMTWAIVFAGVLFAGILALQHLGRGIALRRMANDPDGASLGAGVIEGAIFGLLSLLVAFTFSGAVGRFDDRRHLVTEEAIRISTAWDRIDVLPTSAQPGLRELFRRYLDSRLETYRRADHSETTDAEYARSLHLQHEIWTHGVAAGQASSTTLAGMLFLPAVNEMNDITSVRLMATRMHPPVVVYAMLAVAALIGALLAGYHMAGSKSRSWLHTVAFAAVMAATVYVILDIEYPRLGLIRVDAADAILRDMRRQMETP